MPAGRRQNRKARREKESTLLFLCVPPWASVCGVQSILVAAAPSGALSEVPPSPRRPLLLHQFRFSRSSYLLSIHGSDSVHGPPPSLPASRLVLLLPQERQQGLQRRPQVASCQLGHELPAPPAPLPIHEAALEAGPSRHVTPQAEAQYCRGQHALGQPASTPTRQTDKHPSVDEEQQQQQGRASVMGFATASTCHMATNLWLAMARPFSHLPTSAAGRSDRRPPPSGPCSRPARCTCAAARPGWAPAW